MNELARIFVRGDTAYDVVVGRGCVESVAAMLPADTIRVGVVHAEGTSSIAARVIASLSTAGFRVVAIPIPDGESAKTVEVAATCWSVLGRNGFTRSDALVCVGGGVTTDLGGFVAATWLRGVAVVHVPTTLLGMVDAAVGGKTGVNTAEGKNLVGAFHSPLGVACDLDLLTTLPRIDLVAGMAEIVKVGFTSDPQILDLVQRDSAAAVELDGDVLPELVQRAIAVKAAVVSSDPRETKPSGLGREVLNYGHTFAHAIENVEGYTWRHGDAVAVGLMFVSTLSRLAGRLGDSDALRHEDVLTGLGLPTSYASGRFPELLEAMQIDKKNRGDQLRFVVLDAIGEPGLLEGPSVELLETAYAEISKGSP